MTHPGRDLIVIGASAGGVEALQRLASNLPANLPASVFVVLHIWPDGKSLLPTMLARAGPLPAVHPEHGDPIEKGKIYVAPNDMPMFVEEGRILLLRGSRENRFRPAITPPLFRSAAAA